jgi:hypothetical protein
MSQNTPNKTDQAVNSFFHSKTWKVILTIWLCLFVASCLCVCMMLVLPAMGITLDFLGMLGRDTIKMIE